MGIMDAAPHAPLLQPRALQERPLALGAEGKIGS